MTLLRNFLFVALVAPGVVLAAPKVDLKSWNEIVLQDRKAFTANAPRRFYASMKVPQGFEPQYAYKKEKIGAAWRFTDVYYQDVGDSEEVGATPECSKARALRSKSGTSVKPPSTPCSYLNVHYVPIEMMKDQRSPADYFAEYKKFFSSGEDRYFKEPGKENLVYERELNFPGGVGRDYLYYSALSQQLYGQPLSRVAILIKKDKEGKISKLLHVIYVEQDWRNQDHIFGSNSEWKNEAEFERVISSVSFSK